MSAKNLKSGSTTFALKGVTSRRKRLLKGIQALETAFATLELSVADERSLQSILESSKSKLSELERVGHAANLYSRSPLSGKTNQSPTKSELKELKRLAGEKLAAEQQSAIDVMHKKSGYNDFVHRLPGSFEGGRK